MVEISNSVLGALVLVTLVVAAAGTYVALINTPHGSSFSFTGFATQGSGNVTLTINQTLAIEVNAGANEINFGTCSPRAGTSYWCASNDAAVCTGVDNDLGNCTGDTAVAQYIQVDNVGNVDADITLDSTCDAATLIGGTSPLLQYQTGSCNGTAVTSWTGIVAASPGQAGCDNVSYLGGAMRFYVNVTIPNDARGSSGACLVNQTVITFTGAPAN